MIGLTFKNIHSSNFGVICKSDNRTLLPARHDAEYIIPNRHGKVRYGFGNYRNRQIAVEICFTQNPTWEALREKARNVAGWLSGDGNLIFDDEPNRAYTAGVYGELSLEQIVGAASGSFVVTFDCFPFAETPTYRQETETFTNKPHDRVIKANGTQETPCIIIIKNVGTANLSNIIITRKAGG